MNNFKLGRGYIDNSIIEVYPNELEESVRRRIRDTLRYGIEAEEESYRIRHERYRRRHNPIENNTITINEEQQRLETYRLQHELYRRIVDSNNTI
jgi:hypothetical protein